MNRYPAWKFVLMVIAVLAGLLYTVPNLYGEAPAVQISAAKLTTKIGADTVTQVEQLLAAAKIKPDPVLIAAGESASGYDDIHAAEHGRSATLSLLTLPDPPSALVALNDMHAVGACAAVREIGCTVPNHVSVVGIDDINLAALLYPPLTTVRHPVKPLSDAAVDLLVKRIEGQERGPSRQIVFEPTLVVRGSTAPCAKTKANLGKSQLTRSAVKVWGNSRA